MKDKQINEVVNLYLKSVESIKAMENKRWVFGDVVLYSSQMHAIRAIGMGTDINLTSLASVMGITKAGASKFIIKLHTYDFIEKYQCADNKKEIYFKLTEKGEFAYKMHEQFSHTTFSEIYAMLGSMSGEDIVICKDFLEKLTTLLEKSTKEI